MLIRIKSPNMTLSREGKKDPLGEGCKTPKNEAQRDKPVIEGNQTSAILLKLTMLQGMHPIKFPGNPQVITQPSETEFETIWRMESSMIVRN